MFSLQKLLGKDDKFFSLMEGSAEESRVSIRSLIEIVHKPEDKRTMERFVEARRNDKRITKELTEHLCKTFVTPLEREDIEALSHALYRIPKVAEKFAERMLLAPVHVRGLDLQKHLAMLEQAADTVVLMVKELRKGVNIEVVQKHNDQLQHIEGEADGLMLETLRDLYNGDHSVIKVIVLKDLFELLEKVFDRCRDVGNIVFHIVLKHS
ncbi:MAG: uncharacterized protein QOF48_1394 [Verrucomicrobiota bacterium]